MAELAVLANHVRWEINVSTCFFYETVLDLKKFI